MSPSRAFIRRWRPRPEGGLLILSTPNGHRSSCAGRLAEAWTFQGTPDGTVIAPDERRRLSKARPWVTDTPPRFT